MAPSVKCLSLLFLLVSLSAFSTEARVSEFFSKAMRFDAAPTELSSTKDEDPSKFTFTSESSNGYGLYGHGAEETPAAEYNTPAQEFHVGNYDSKGSNTPAQEFHVGNYDSKGSNTPAQEFHVGNYDSKGSNTPAQEFHVGNYDSKGSSHAKEYRNAEPTAEGVEFENKEFTTSYPEKEEYDSREHGTRYPAESNEFENQPAREYDNVAATRNYEKGHFDSNYPREQYGMSDTRVFENGRYFYDVKNQNYRGNPYASTTANGGYGNKAYTGATENQNEYQDNPYKGGYRSRQDNPDDDMP
ncbi:protein E6-like [Aristolochia californica]|uniref:protein E6-like n=1 Tax=Aristolochia californica TaxID=171875 RepID=UPI0035E0E2E8